MKPKTRSQLKRVEIEKKKITSENMSGTNTKKLNNKKEGKVISSKRSINEKPGWTNIKDVEEKLRELEKQYKRASDTKTRKKLSTLIDTYEKQVKAINVAIVQEAKNKQEENNKTNKKEIFTIQEESESENEDSNSIMSDITMKTMNSVQKSPYKDTASKNLFNKDVNKSKTEKKKQGENNNTTVVLESLGTTRKHSMKSDGKKMTAEAAKITQDDSTVMSEITINREPKENETPENTQENNINEEEKINKCDEVTIMSTYTNTQQKATPNRNENDNKNDKQEKNDGKHDGEEKGKNEIKDISESKKPPEDVKEDDTVMSETTIRGPINKEEQKEQGKKTLSVTQTPGKTKKVENPYKSKTPIKNLLESSNKQEKYANVVKKSIDGENKVSKTKRNSKNTNNNNEIRIRFSFTGQDKGE